MAEDPTFKTHDAKIDAKATTPDNVVPLVPKGSASPVVPMELRLAAFPDPCSIPPREWLYGTQLIRDYVTVLVAPGGTGKSAYAMGVVLSMVTNRSLLGEHIFTPVNGLIFNLDDPMNELNRRMAALMMHHKITPGQMKGKLYLEDGERRGDEKKGLTMASIDEGDGFTVVHPDEEALIASITKNNIGVVVCDPFAESHNLEENSNPMMVKAAAAWRRVARKTHCAVLLVHHVRKGEASGIDAARGAKALTDSARVGLLMSTMTAADAEKFGIDDDDRLGYVRIDDAKRNMAPPAKAKWYQLREVALGNTGINPLYPAGDKVVAIAPWTPPESDLATASVDELNEALDAIAAGPKPGVLYTASKRGKSNDRWCGHVLIDMFDVPEKQAAKMICDWIKNGTLFDTQFRYDGRRKEVRGVAVNDTLRPGRIQ